ncbi:MAG: hypothetical protein HKO48_00265 [Nitrosopumilus sp.]|nr:hypothetical protein [Nitrosopumilus sp.]NNL37081.1 hypothetical protein [Nitrosopumilus sp.]NNM35537.1 hypothetical protein [Nitrosopumilus sp.]
MTRTKLPEHLEDKIFEIRYLSDDSVSKIISYFAFSESEKEEILLALNDESFDGFHSIFTDNVTEEQWSKTKEQIKKKFKDELFDIDKN